MTGYLDPGSGSMLLGIGALVVGIVVVGIVLIVKAAAPKPQVWVQACPTCRSPLTGQPFCGNCGQSLVSKQSR